MKISLFSITQLVDKCKSCILIGYATRGLVAKLVAKFAGVSLVLFPNEDFNLHLLSLLLSFLSDQLSDTKPITPHGLLTRGPSGPTGIINNYFSSPNGLLTQSP